MTPTEAQAEHDAYYSNPDKQDEYLREEGYTDEEIADIRSADEQ
ncbi:hypothetical protein ACLI4Z_14320 [Natrialbaceae archaeon A-arb3/5]